MKGILEFDRTEEEKNFRASVKGPDMAFIIYDFLNNGHLPYKYDDNPYYKGIIEAQKKIYEALEEQKIIIDDLTE